jgi:hypothetical protein
MDNWRKYTVMVLIVGLLNLPLADLTLARGVKSTADPAAIKQRVEVFGVGASLSVRLTGGKKTKGSIVGLGEDGFALMAKPGEAPRHVAYNTVSEVKPGKLTYRAKRAPDAVEARRVVLGLGVGRHIQVKTTAGQEYHGNIQVVGPDTFTMLPDGQTAPVEIAYSDTASLGPNMSRGEKIATIAGVAGVALLVLYLIGRTQVD